MSSQYAYMSAPSSRVDALKTKHASLSQTIENELRHPASSDSLITRLKKQKLRLKEEIFRIEELDQYRQA
mgnify:CR=1 FL=1